MVIKVKYSLYYLYYSTYFSSNVEAVAQRQKKNFCTLVIK